MELYYPGVNILLWGKILKCINPNCITNKETIETKFNVIEEKPLKIQCHYCEKTMTNIRFAE